MTIDTRIINGHFVTPDGVKMTELSVHLGKFVHDPADRNDVWRTVNASGFFVFPGVIQPSAVCGEQALAAAAEGTTTAIAAIDSANAQTIEADLDWLAHNAQMDYMPCWIITDQVDTETIQVVRGARISVAEIRTSKIAAKAMESLDEMTVRIDASNPIINALATRGGHRVLVARIHSESDIDNLRRLGDDRLAIEVDSGTLANRPSLWNAIAHGGIHHVVSGGAISGTPLLQFLWHEGVVNRGIDPTVIARLTSIQPALSYPFSGTKGAFDIDCDADLFVFDPADRDNLNDSDWSGRVIFSLMGGDIFLFNGELHSLVGHGTWQR